MSEVGTGMSSGGVLPHASANAGGGAGAAGAMLGTAAYAASQRGTLVLANPSEDEHGTVARYPVDEKRGGAAGYGAMAGASARAARGSGVSRAASTVSSASMYTSMASHHAHGPAGAAPREPPSYAQSVRRASSTRPSTGSSDDSGRLRTLPPGAAHPPSSYPGSYAAYADPFLDGSDQVGAGLYQSDDDDTLYRLQPGKVLVHEDGGSFVDLREAGASRDSGGGGGRAF